MKKKIILFLYIAIFCAVFWLNSHLGMALHSVLKNALALGITIFLLHYLLEKLLNEDVSDYGITGFKLTAIWVLVSLVVPISYLCFMFFTDGMWKTDSFSFVGVVLIISECILNVLLSELIFSGVVFYSIVKLYGKVFAVLAVSVLFALTKIDFSQSEMEMITVFIEAFVIRIMLSVITLHSENIWNSVYMSFVINVFHSLFNFGNYSEIHPWNYVTGVSNILVSAIRFADYFVIIIICCMFLIKKRRAQVFYW